MNLKNFQESHLVLLEIEKERLKQLRDLLNQITFDEFEVDNQSKYYLNNNEDTHLDQKKNDLETSFNYAKKNLIDNECLCNVNNNNYKQIKRIENSCIDDTAPYLFLNLGSYEQTRKRLADERRREYNEYLKEREKLDAQKSRRLSRSRILTGDINYSALLELKERENKKFDQLNGLDIIEESDEINKISKIIINQPETTCSRNSNENDRIFSHILTEKSDDYDDYNDEYITPRHRLLSTKKSQMTAMKYREELKKQIDENRLRKEQELKRQEEEDKKLDAIIAQQQRKMKYEFEEERKKLANLTDLRLKRKPINLNENDNLSLRTINSRSPSYKQLRTRFSAVNSERQSPIIKITKDGDLSNEMRRVTKKIDTNEKVFIDSIEKPKTILTEEKAHENENNEKMNVQGKQEETKQTEVKTIKYFDASDIRTKDDILSRLSLVRRQMHEDHIKLLKRIQEYE